MLHVKEEKSNQKRRSKKSSTCLHGCRYGILAKKEEGTEDNKVVVMQTMKHRIQDIYGTERAIKFKASNYWFSRFRKRYQISLRNRTNKKQKSADDCRLTI